MHRLLPKRKIYHYIFFVTRIRVLPKQKRNLYVGRLLCGFGRECYRNLILFLAAVIEYIDRLSSCYLAAFHLQFIKINSYRYFWGTKNVNRTGPYTKWIQKENNISVFFSRYSRLREDDENQRGKKAHTLAEHTNMAGCRLLRMRGIVKARNQNECNKKRLNRPKTAAFTDTKSAILALSNSHRRMKSYFIILVTDIVILFAQHAAAASVLHDAWCIMIFFFVYILLQL